MRKLKKSAPVTIEDMKKVLERIKDKNPTGDEFLVDWGGAVFLAALRKTLGLDDKTTLDEETPPRDEEALREEAGAGNEEVFGNEELFGEEKVLGEEEVFGEEENFGDEDTFADEDIDESVVDPGTLFHELLPQTDEDVLAVIFEEMTGAFAFPEDNAEEWIDASELLHLIACHEYNQKTEPENWDFPESFKEDFITAFDGIVSDGYTEEPALTLFTAFVRDLADEGLDTALHILGYHSYGGSPAFPCDFEVSRDCISRLFEENGDPIYANTLGYIAYHGRCGDGVPDYDAAFRYFSYGAASGIIESSYKLADLFAGGKGIWKNEEAALRIVSDLYQDTLRRFCGGELNGKFADVALRMGRLYENGSVEEPNPVAAYYYYLQARYAIRFRRRLANDYGDDVVERNIENAITRVAAEVPQEKGKTFKSTRPWVLQMALAMDKHVLVTFKQLKSGIVKMVLDRYEEDDADLHDFLITIPEHSFCSMMETVTLSAGKAEDCFIADPGVPVLITSAMYEPVTNRWIFMQGNEVAASFGTRGFSMKADIKG